MIRNAIYELGEPLDLVKMVEEGIFCFRGPDDEVRYDNASICLSNKILTNRDVADAILKVIYSRIRNWDREDVNVLLSDLKKAISIMELNPDDYPGFASCGLDIEKIPSENVPGDIEDRCHVWAMDKQGMCLVGADADRIRSVYELRNTVSDV